MKLTEKVKKAVTTLKRSKIADDVYRAIWYEHVLEDVKRVMHESKANLTKEEKAIAESAAERYVYDGDYDCNLPYWSNIENLLNELGFAG